MSRIVFVDPQDPNEKYFEEMGEEIPSDGDHLVCYFEDASYSMVMNGDIKELEDYMKSNGITNMNEYMKKEAKEKTKANETFNESYDAKNESINFNSLTNDEKEGQDEKVAKNDSKDSLESMWELSAGFKKYLNTRSVRSALKLRFEGRIPLKFKWLKKKIKRTKKKETEIEGGFKKKIWKEAAAQIYKDFDYNL